MLKKNFLLLIVFCIKCILTQGQSLPVGIQALEDKYRRDQLLGKLDSTISFTIRPLTNSALQKSNIYDPDGLLNDSKSIIRSSNQTSFIQLMPASIQIRNTSKYPYGWNDGPMIPQPGLQSLLSAGIYAKYRFISVQFNPEFLLAQNKFHSGYANPDIVNDQMWSVWYEYYNRIDMPERFGNGSYNRAFWGQSYVRFNFDEFKVPLSLGFSTENLWWGPGMRNSLLMTNTAPGFAHITLNTTKPIKTPIGSFEAQMIGGRLDSSGFAPRQITDPQGIDRFYNPKPDDWRYISGVTANYQPKWVPGLFLGLSRSFIIYHQDMGNSISDYIPLFTGLLKDRFDDPDGGINLEDRTRRDQYISLFARWAMPKAHAEFYFEYGRNDHSYNFRDLIGQLDHTRAYVIGFRKLVPLNRQSGAMLQINGEVTQLEMTRADEYREGQSWYTHYQVRGGYTNKGQIIGAGIGPGSNVQSVNISWLRGLKQIGLQFERYVHNNDYYYSYIRNPRQNWVDLSASLHGEWDYKNFIFTGKIHYMKAFNYQYKLYDYLDDRFGTMEFEPVDIKNWQIQVGALYRF